MPWQKVKHSKKNIVKYIKKKHLELYNVRNSDLDPHSPLIYPSSVWLDFIT